jgi:outer membrane protein assembly factor BamD
VRTRHIVVAALGICLGGSVCVNAYGQKNVKKVKDKKTDASESAEPDKLLYDRAIQDIKKGHYIEGRLSYQTLINTYPDSEYLAKAKLGIADSYYKEGGTANMTQAIETYKDFITFFPFLDEAAYAQMQVGMAYYRMMEKSDRDISRAQSAEDELQTFLLKYPDSPLRAKTEQYLRDVQEILADGQFKIARFYYVKMDYRASTARLVELTGRYPLYSENDEALWMLGDVYFKVKQASKNEDDKNHWSDLAAQCYDRIIENYPISKRTADAKARLTAMGMKVPPPDPNALARMQKEQLYAKNHHQNAVIKFPVGFVKSGPDVSTAAHSGEPNLNPPDDEVSATDVLKPGASGPSFNLAMRPTNTSDPNAAVNAGDSGPVEAVSTVSSGSASASGANVGAEIIAVGPGAGNGSAAVSANSSSSSSVNSTSALTETPSNSVNAPALTPEPAPNSGSAPPGTESPSLVTTQPAATGNNGTADAAPEKTKSDSKAESTSKKKKGIHKLIPF